MNKTIWLAIILSCAAVAAIVYGAFWYATNPDGHPDPQPIITNEPGIVNEPTGEPEDDHDHAHEHNDTDEDGNVDLTAHMATAASGASEYFTFRLDETAEERAARLGMYFTADAAGIGSYPAAAKQEWWGRDQLTITITVDTVDLVAPESDTPTGDGYRMSVFLTYRAVYTQTGNEQIVVDRAEVTIDVPVDGTQKATSISVR